MAERHVSELLGEVFRRTGMKRAVRRAEAVVWWPRVVGRDVARFTTARALRDGVLYVEVSDSETAMHLSLQRTRFLERYEHTLGRREVRDIRFRVGRPEASEGVADGAGTSRDAPGAARPRTPDPQRLAELARSLGAMDLPEPVAGAAMRAGRSWLGYRASRSAEGWTPCPTCGALHPDPGPCPACRRYRHEGRVKAAARRLAIDPGQATPELGEEERAVAEDLAAAALDAALLELLPQVIADPELRPQLERAARCRAALASRMDPSDVGEAQLARLDPRVRRVLGLHP